MSQYQQSSDSLGRNQGGGSVRRARDMLNAGVRADSSLGQQDNTAMPQPLRPRPAHSRDSSQEADIEIGYQVEHDPRGPVPIMPIQHLPVPKHSGPPPTSRRGPSSVYSRLTAIAVSPIPEENFKSLKKKKESFASSTVIPSSWGSGPPMSEILDAYESEPEELKREEPKRKRDSLALLRQASVGKRGKPSLRTISKSQPEAQPINEKYDQSSDSSLGYSTVNGLQPRASLDSVSTDADSIDLEKERIVIENQQKARSIGIGLGLARPGAGMSSKKPNSHRPPRLDMSAVKSAEAQGSLTSLPDLIRRATKVASNLEHGRTASRLGILDMFDFGRESKRANPANHRSSASLSDILASFPPPRTGTPDESVRTSWPFPPMNNGEKSRLREMHTNISADEAQNNGKSRRRCCGMSLPVFIFVCIIVVCIIAAAVIIPVVLVVLPKNKDHSTTASAANTTSTVNTCEQKLPCANGGVSVQSGSTCSCVCVNGFSGTQCSTTSDGSCTTTETTQSGNATVGSSLPSIFTESETDFDIPLNETQILSLFNANNISCTVQNALVEFGGISSSKVRRRGSPIEIRDLDSEAQVITATEIIKRAQETQATATYVPPILSVPTDTATESSSETGGAMKTAAPTATSTGSATKTTATTASASASSAISAATTQVYDFARVAVLFIFEQTQDIDAATTAQKDIDLYLLSQSIGTATNMNMSVSMPETFVLSFTNFTITLSNGTVIGGGNGTAT